MKAFYYVLNVLFGVAFILVLSAQNPPGKPDPVDDTAAKMKPKPITKKDRERDSLYSIANAVLDKAIKYEEPLNAYNEELSKSKNEQRQAIKTYIRTVNAYLKEIGRQDKVIVRTSLKQQLRDGEIFFVKDSTCVNSKKRFLGKPKCTQWAYSWYLIDKNGKVEKL